MFCAFGQQTPVERRKFRTSPILHFMNRRVSRVFMFVLLPGLTLRLSAAIIATNTPTESLTVERITTLPAVQQSAWREYWSRSQRQRQEDQNALRNELRIHGLKAPIVPPAGFSARSIPLIRPVTWYGSTDAIRIAKIVVSFQTPAGGWSKNLNLAMHARVPAAQQ